ncbi:MAG: helix-turn-helix domain-containing protein [Hamadaea sp.]|uniref:helix-turn-helix domain-containing protein n=1 Tax=Hamadaea sp. TaxID=2024425 RepID=UPI0018546656|nr:helix-turn-helix transcriptional regulator [Hamadaea sp.]NUT21918.1 helix-turn-helix domain-containing protein [Hamadaea sp.]
MEPATSRLHGPTIARRRLSQALRAARDDTGRTQEQAADALDWSISKMIRIENGKTKPTVTDVKALLQLYGVTEAGLIDEFIDLARATRQRSWWMEYRDRLPGGYADYVALESDASHLSFFQPLFVPGLLQTAAYARAILRTTAIEGLSPEDQEVRAEVRRLRQANILGGPKPPRIDAIIDESVLLRVAGDATVMREQLEHLVQLGRDPQIHVRVLPFKAGIHTVSSPFILMEFPVPTDEDLVYVESGMTQPAMIDRVDPQRYWSAYQRLEEMSLGIAESRRFLTETARKFL